MIEVGGLRKRFGRLDVLRGVDLTIETGRITALVGPNGSGKTTLIKTLLGLVRADEGRIAVGGRALDGAWDYRDRIGYMPQLPRFPDNLTAREVLALLGDLRPGVPQHRTLLGTLRLESQLDRPLGTLSGGTRQRINAAIAFLFDPDLLILDEPTAGLDPAASAVLKDYVRAARDHGRTIIVTSHVMAELEQLADDVALLLDGRIHFSGSLESLRAGTGEASLERAIASLMTDYVPDPLATDSPAGAASARSRQSMPTAALEGVS